MAMGGDDDGWRWRWMAMAMAVAMERGAKLEQSFSGAGQ
jgi:hypothetical protein